MIWLAMSRISLSVNRSSSWDADMLFLWKRSVSKCEQQVNLIYDKKIKPCRELYHVINSKQGIIRLLIERGRLQCQLQIFMVVFQMALDLQPPKHSRWQCTQVKSQIYPETEGISCSVHRFDLRDKVYILLMCFLLLEMFLPSVFSCFSSFRAKWLISSWRFL